MAIAGCGAAPPRAFTPADDTGVRAVLTAQQAAWNRGDLAGYMAGYAKGGALVFTSGGKIRRGWRVFSVVLERTRDGWLVVHDHTSADPPPATP